MTLAEGREKTDKGEGVMSHGGGPNKIVAPPSWEPPVELTRVKPSRAISAVFWGLRLYIALMVVLVVIGFLRGMH